MNDEAEIKGLLREIRDNQRTALERQAEQLAIAREQLERARAQVAESLALQKQAMQRFKSLSWIVLPLIAICLGLIGYLVVRYL